MLDLNQIAIETLKVSLTVKKEGIFGNSLISNLYFWSVNTETLIFSWHRLFVQGSKLQCPIA